MRKILLLFLAIIIFSVPVFANEINVTVNGMPIEFDQPPINQGGRTLVPVRAIFEALGASIEWDAGTQTVSSERGDVNVSLTIGSNILRRNAEEITLDVAAQIVGGRTLVPARAVAESFGAEVGWDADTRTVTIDTGDRILLRRPDRISRVYYNEGDSQNNPVFLYIYWENGIPSMEMFYGSYTSITGQMVSDYELSGVISSQFDSADVVPPINITISSTAENSIVWRQTSGNVRTIILNMTEEREQ
ncbi:MAG: copper amine oxidase N-terminal domain-containing protein [Clostridiales bacterium]|jgi:hypothetical protein|nr:copper amine oxidase N-terminal domain-containing protein [Clostridiales bacterium]